MLHTGPVSTITKGPSGYIITHLSHLSLIRYKRSLDIVSNEWLLWLLWWLSGTVGAVQEDLVITTLVIVISSCSSSN